MVDECFTMLRRSIEDVFSMISLTKERVQGETVWAFCRKSWTVSVWTHTRPPHSPSKAKRLNYAPQDDVRLLAFKLIRMFGAVAVGGGQRLPHLRLK